MYIKLDYYKYIYIYINNAFFLNKKNELFLII